MPGPSITNLSSELNIIVQFGDVIFTHADLLNFSLNNKLNERPFGEFTLVDRNSDFVKTKSGDFGAVFFSNTSDGKGEKVGLLEFIVDELVQETIVASNTIYKIKWSAGNKQQLKKHTRAFSGISIDAVDEVFSFYDTSNITYPAGAPRPTDVMTWRNIQEDMWQQLDTIIEKSFLRNDYLFWAWDEVNNTFRVSSLRTEASAQDRYIIIQSSDALTSTEAGKVFLENPDTTIWQYSRHKRLNDLGKNRDKLFPNVAFSGIRDADILTADMKQATFSEFLREVGDDKQDEVLESTGLDEDTDVFGELDVRRHWPNNIHKLYSFADIYRDYKLATYPKIIFVQLHNNVGPPIGSKVTLIKMGDDYKVAGLSLDEEFSDSFIVFQKLITYTPVNKLTSKGGANKNEAIVITLKLISDNFAGNGVEHVTQVFEQINKRKRITS